MIFKFLVWFIISNQVVNGQSEGDQCTNETATGTWTKLRDCSELEKDLKPQVRAIYANTLVCCLGQSTRYARDTIPLLPSQEVRILQPSAACPPIDPNLTTNKTGRPAWDKCIDYQESMIPCLETLIPGLGPRRNYCDHGLIELITGGVETARVDEYPHMALLGQLSESKYTWFYTGSLISELYVLTSARTLTSRSKPSFVRLGVYIIEDDINSNDIYEIAQAIVHPQLDASRNLNDIGLIRLNRAASFSTKVVPACLHTGGAIDDGKAVSTGWSTDYDEYKWNIKRTFLNKCNMDDRKSQSQNKTTQLCYGVTSSQSCFVNVGSPLQVLNKKVTCTYTLIGVAVTPFPENCGVSNTGIFTKVSAFVPWIESIVWP